MNLIRRGLLLGLTLLLALPAVASAADAPTIDTGATAWMLTSTALVLLMVPGLAMFYGGLVRTKNVLGTMMHSFVAMAIIGVMWGICGYAMCFGSNILGGWIGWDPNKAWLVGLDGSVVAPMGVGVPEYVFAMFQGKFAIITPALIAGAIAERVRFRGYCVLIFLWALLVYNPLCHWVWASDGYFFKMGAIDFAGGTVVHISAGVSGLVMAIYLGVRKGYPKTVMQPNNLVMTMMGAGLLWVGWFGFNAGSSVASSNLSARALTVTQVAAATGALAWILIESLHHHKATSLGFCSGILAGLVAITPAAGHVGVPGALALGVLASLICYGAIMLKSRIGYDDSLDVFGIHGVAGIFGALALTFFISPVVKHELIAANAGWTVAGQFVTQAKAVGASILYSGICSIILVVLVDKTLGLRLDPTRESAGMDHSLHGEHGYGLLNLH